VSSKKLVFMVGPALDAKGGIASVCAAYREGGLFGSLGVEYLESFVSGTGIAKVRAGVSALARFCVRLALRRVALLHVHMASGTSVWRKLAFCAVARLFGVPYVVHLHSGKFQSYFDARCGPLRRAVIRYALRRAAALLCLSKETVSWLSVRELTPSAVHVLPNPAPCANQLPRSALDTANTDRAVLLFLGRLEEAKGVSTLIEAFASVSRDWPMAELWMGGEGDQAQYEKQVADEGLEPGRVRFLGWVDTAKKAETVAEGSLVRAAIQV
jgi:glycosyltransferase involved in cell wall biosynthesis